MDPEKFKGKENTDEEEKPKAEEEKPILLKLKRPGMLSSFLKKLSL